MNYRLQDMRAFAALSVLFYHVSIHVDGLYGSTILGAVFNRHFGFYGVLVFFFISGYLMAKIAESSSPFEFIVQRFIRIYPSFFIAVLYAAGLSIVFSDSPYWGNPVAYLLLPLGTYYGPLQIEWSLNYEVFFYLIASVFCIKSLNRYYPAFLIFWLVAVLTAVYGFSAYGTSQFPLLHQAFFSGWNIAFIVGSLSFYAMRLAGARTVLCLSGPPVLMLAVFSLLLPDVFPETTRVLWVCAVIGIPTLWYISETPGPYSRQGYHHLLKAIGDRSYGLYLVHQVTASCFQGYVHALLPSKPFLAYFTLIAVCLFAGMAMGEIDIRCHAWLKALLSRRHGRPVLATPNLSMVK